MQQTTIYEYEEAWAIYRLQPSIINAWNVIQKMPRKNFILPISSQLESELRAKAQTYVSIKQALDDWKDDRSEANTDRLQKVCQRQQINVKKLMDYFKLPEADAKEALSPESIPAVIN